MQIELYKFSKRINSTKRPTAGSGLITQCTIKQNAPYVGTFGSSSDTTVCYPVLFLQGVKDPNAYNYCKTFDNRYYFIRDIQIDIDGAATLHCEIDVLATRREEILASRQFVTYSSSDYDMQINDNRQTFYQVAQSQSNTAMLPWAEDPHLIVTAISAGRPLPSIYWIDGANAARLATWFTDPSNLQFWDEMRLYLLAPIDAISSVQICMVDIMYASQDVNIILGNTPITGANGKLVHYETVIHEDPIHVDLGLGINKLDYTYSGQCSRYIIEIPFCGIYELPADAIYAFGKDDGDISVSVRYNVAVATGDITGFVFLGDSTRKILSFNGNCYSTVPWGQNGDIDISALKGIGSAVASSISLGASASLGVNTAGAAALGNTIMRGPKASDVTGHGNAWGRFDMNVGSTVNTMMSGFMEARPEVSLGGSTTGISGYVPLYFDRIKLRREYRVPINGLGNYRDVLGLPCNKYRQLAGLSGFCQCKSPSIVIDDLKVIAELINGYLSSGFFIE